MKTKHYFLFLLIILIFSSSCKPISNLFESGSFLSQFNKGSGYDLPNNLRDEFLSDIEYLTQSSIYTLDIKIDDDGEIMRVKGVEEVIYTNQEEVSLDVIYFRLFPNIGGDYLAVSDVMIDGASIEPIMEFGNTAMRLDLTSPLEPNESITISMQFDEVVPDEMGGNYGLYVYSNEILALDAFFPIIPVFNDEGWNVESPPHNADMIFTDVAFFKVTVDVPDDYVIAAGGNEVTREKKQDRQIVTFTGGPQRDFYLATSPHFVFESQKINGVKVTSYFIEEFRPAGERVLEIGLNALSSFSERFGSYPYDELDLVSTPMQAGGMEYSSIVALGINFYDPESIVYGMPGSVFLEASTAHEVGHEWFYCQVMSDQIDEPWQDESLVQYITSLYYLDNYGKQGQRGFMESLDQRWERVDKDPIPIGLKAAEYAPIEYGAIVYGRGALFFEALAKEMGEETFNTFLKDYVETYRWRVTQPEHLVGMAEEACSCDLSDLLIEWGVTE